MTQPVGSLVMFRGAFQTHEQHIEEACVFLRDLAAGDDVRLERPKADESWEPIYLVAANERGRELLTRFIEDEGRAADRLRLLDAVRIA